MNIFHIILIRSRSNRPVLSLKATPPKDGRLWRRRGESRAEGLTYSSRRRALASTLAVLFLALSVACTAADFDKFLQQAGDKSSNPGTGATSTSGPGATSTSPPAAGTENRNSNNQPNAQVDIGPEVFSEHRAYEHVKELAGKIGSRPAGTDGEKAAADYISSQFMSFGYTVTQQKFSFPFYRDNGSILEVVSPSSLQLTPLTLYYSTGGKVEGPVVFGGQGRPEDLASVDLSSKVALFERGQTTFEQKVSAAASKGSVAAVVYNNQSGGFRGSLQKTSTIPAVAISKEEGEMLRGLLAKGAVSVRVVVDAGLADIQSQNVIANPGKPCTALVGGHYDSVEEGLGANDNASGAAVVIELSRAARSLAFKDGVCFAAFGAEELGLWGSRKHVESLSAEDRGRVKVMVNLDMVGVGDRWRVAGSESAVGMAVDAAAQAEIEIRSFTVPRGQGSDHASFMEAGIASVFIHRLDDPNYHTAEDKVEHVAPEALEQAGKIALGVLERMGGS